MNGSFNGKFVSFRTSRPYVHSDTHAIINIYPSWRSDERMNHVPRRDLVWAYPYRLDVLKTRTEIECIA